ncbi:hypothetical protein LLEC1_08114 [Akanthomyces lecanii]|uniref:Uncharacterized protein n=1 Tax=Cordyceps confragosa TaxID=2714763 RepID=A0A179I9V5_CORDF|nr:hypothetical protein LLEC1_08114 [Akanthomyces lecanii]
MTRVSVYSAALVAFLLSAAMVVASIAMPNWIDYAVTTAKGDTIRKTIGLHRSCSTLDGGRCSPGWPFVGGLIAAFSAVQLIVISVVAYLFDNDDQFIIPGWQLGASWYLALFSAVLGTVTVVGLVLSAYLLAPEDGYEFLDEPMDA